MTVRESRNPSADRAARTATFCAASMIAAQVAGKATRDALFLSEFHISALPLVLIAAAFLSIGVTLLVSRLLAAHGPGRVTPPAFVLSAVLLLAEWGIASFSPRTAAIAVYLHTASLGAVLISGFWSLLNEQFDPRSAKRRIARIGVGGTLGGVFGGLAAERVGTYLSVPSMLPLLAFLHLACFLLLRRTGTGADSSVEGGPAAAEPAVDGRREPSGLGTIRRMPYLRNLAILVAAGTIAAACIDYVFKARAAAMITDGGELMRFFALFYTAISLITFFVQSGAAWRVLERFGLARAVASLPLAVAGGSLGALFAPGLASAAVARGLESTLRSSLFRSGYELLYTPIRLAEKRAAKPFIDIGADRLGDMLGGALIRLVLLLPIAAVEPILLAIALFLGACGLILTRRLHLGYIGALERSLVSRAVALRLDDVEDRTTRTTMIQTLSGLGLPTEFEKSSGAAGGEGERASQDREAPPDRLADLRSGDPELVREVLSRGGKIDPGIAPEIVSLLAWDEVTGDAARALARIAPRITGLLVDRLLNEGEEFAIRRRIPGILGACPTDQSVTGLIDALGDIRFEVRFRSGRSLSRIRKRDPGRPVDRERILSAVLREVQVDRRVWESRRLLDTPGDDEESIFVDEVLRDRADRSLEHVFDLLALVLPSEHLKVAFRGLHTTDITLRGTALEYLESVLPDEVRTALWPFLETEKWEPSEKRSRKTIVEDLLRSNQSIRMNLEELRRKRNR